MSVELMRKRLAADRASVIEPCLPSPANEPASGAKWIHEIKHDGYRLMARRDPIGIRLLTRNGHDWAPRYPLVVEAVNHLKVRSCLIDGEVVCCDEQGLAIFQLLRHRKNEASAFLFAFDLLELDGTDMRREPIEVRKATLASILRKARHGVRLNEHLEHPDGALVFAARLQDGPGGHRVEAARLALSLGPLARLAEVQKSGGAGGQAGGGRGLGKMRKGCASSRLVSETFDFLDRSNTGSANNTPKSDIAMLARIQNLASLN